LIRPNKFAGDCSNPECQSRNRVKPGEGHVSRVGSTYKVFHKECLSPEVVGQAVAAERGRVEDILHEFDDFAPSEYQRHIQHVWFTTTNHILVNAVAGSGKTKTILWLLSALQDVPKHRKPRVLLCCFGREIKAELSNRIIPGSADAKTLNAVGHRMIRDWLQPRGIGIEFDKDKLAKIVKRLFPVNDLELCEFHGDRPWPLREAFRIVVGRNADPLAHDAAINAELLKVYERNLYCRKTVTDLANLRRATLSNDDKSLSEIYSVELPNACDDEMQRDCMGSISSSVTRVLDECRRMALEEGVVGYGDQVWIPVTTEGMRCFPYDEIFVDEAQDLNEAQFQLLLKIRKVPGKLRRPARIVFVGDRKQAVFGFRGAGMGMLDRIKAGLEEFAKRGDYAVSELDLSFCYRCPSKVIDYVLSKGHVTQIKSSPGSFPGSVEKIKDAGSWDSGKWNELLDERAMILCRTNAPLANAYLKVLKTGRAVSMRGRKSGCYSKLLRLSAKSSGPGGIPGMVKRARKSSQRMIENLWKIGRKPQAITVADTYECLLILSEDCETVQEFRSLLGRVFEDGKEGGVVLSTVHQAKGLEADTVVILRPDLLPMLFFARTEDQVNQEKNLEYVGLTRPKKRLVIAEPMSKEDLKKGIRSLFPGIKLED